LEKKSFILLTQNYEKCLIDAFENKLECLCQVFSTFTSNNVRDNTLMEFKPSMGEIENLAFAVPFKYRSVLA
jgi:hypothetical protein